MVDEYSSLPFRIQQIYDTCQPEEQEYLLQILKELSEDGESKTYDTLWLQDFTEIPVDILTFICDDRYLGQSNSHGEAVYPYWKDCMSEIYQDLTRYQEIVFTGATRIGKTSTAVTCAAYQLYWLMCLRDPQEFFNKKDISKFSLLFFNITKDAARGVAFRELNDLLKSSQWFNERGQFSKSERDFYYIPDGGKIDIDYGSDASHSLGKQVFCLTGNIKITTNKGLKRLDELVDETFKVLQYNNDENEIQWSGKTTCKLMKYTDETMKITLEDGSIIEGTPDHRIMLKDGTYKMLKDLTTNDELMEVK